jgi:serine/threonine-protein kinase
MKGEMVGDAPNVVGRFTILDKLGEGGMGIVYRAHDPTLDRDVALKLVHPSHAGAEARDRLFREAQALARVAHPNVVSIYEVGAQDDYVFIAMELVPGETLSRWLSREPRDHVEIVEKFVQAARGLGAAHRVGGVVVARSPASPGSIDVVGGRGFDASVEIATAASKPRAARSGVAP